MTIQIYVTNISNDNLTLTHPIALFGVPLAKANAPWRSEINPINFILNIARYVRHKSAVELRLNDIHITPQSIFNAKVKHFIQKDFQVQQQTGLSYYFPLKWCINDTIVSLVNERLHFSPIETYWNT